MAEAIVRLVLRKLADASVNEIVFLCGAGDKLDSIRRELNWIRAFLKDADSKCNSDERVKTWVNDVRGVAYKIEDVIDTFMTEVYSGNQSGRLNALKQKMKCVMKLPTVHKLTAEMDKIQKTILKIKELIERYGINRELGDNSSTTVLMRRPILLPDEDDPDVVGLRNDTDNIVKLLLDPNTKRHCLVSIVGQGGLGKTTLARKVYNRDAVKREFGFRLWLLISQQYNTINLLKMILEKIRPLKELDEKALPQNNDQNSQLIAVQYFITQLKEPLSQMRYLIIMDDVWQDDLWEQVKVALPDVGNGSRVLVTTRSTDIARKADTITDPYQLCFLNEEESQHLLLKKAFPHHDLKTSPHDLSDLLKKFAQRSGGLPLALQVVGGLLSIKPTTYSSWHKVFEKFSWDGGEGKKCTDVLATSYECKKNSVIN